MKQQPSENTFALPCCDVATQAERFHSGQVSCWHIRVEWYRICGFLEPTAAVTIVQRRKVSEYFEEEED
jgi:hypothetical protein